MAGESGPSSLSLAHSTSPIRSLAIHSLTRRTEGCPLKHASVWPLRSTPTGEARSRASSARSSGCYDSRDDSAAKSSVTIAQPRKSETPAVDCSAKCAAVESIVARLATPALVTKMSV